MATMVNRNGRESKRRTLWAIRAFTVLVIVVTIAQTLPNASGAALAGTFAGLGFAALLWYAILFRLLSKPATEV